jgi:hypothetical protein
MTASAEPGGEVEDPVVFVSYAHESGAHKDLVLDFCRFLRSKGVRAWVDRYDEGQRQDWDDWMAAKIDNAAFVLVIASPTYRRVAGGGVESNEHRGVQKETRILKEKLYQNHTDWHRKILPVLFPGCTPADIPEFLGPAASSHYEVTDLTLAGTWPLLYVLLGQSPHDVPPVGTVPTLAPYIPATPWPSAARATLADAVIEPVASPPEDQEFADTRRWRLSPRTGRAGIVGLLVAALVAGALGPRYVWRGQQLTALGDLLRAVRVPDLDLVGQASKAVVSASDWTTVPFGPPAAEARRRGSYASHAGTVELQDGSRPTHDITAVLRSAKAPTVAARWLAVVYALPVPLTLEAVLDVVTGFPMGTRSDKRITFQVQCIGGRLPATPPVAQWNASGHDRAPLIRQVGLSTCTGATSIRLVVADAAAQSDEISAVWAQALLRWQPYASMTTPAIWPESTPPGDQPAAAITSPVNGQRISQCTTIRGVASRPVSGEAYWLLLRESGRDLFVKAPVLVTPSSQWVLNKLLIIGRLGPEEREYNLILVRTNHPTSAQIFDNASRQDNQNLGRTDLPPGAVIADQIEVTRTTGTTC